MRAGAAIQQIDHGLDNGHVHTQVLCALQHGAGADTRPRPHGPENPRFAPASCRWPAAGPPAVAAEVAGGGQHQIAQAAGGP